MKNAHLLVLLAVVSMIAAPMFAAATDVQDIPAKPTFAEHVAPIFYEKCVSCHQPDEIGPMSLVSYDEIRPWAKSIGKYVKNREMPPWDADPGQGPWVDDRSMTDVEIETIVRWAKAGAPSGDLSTIAPPPAAARQDGWKLGKPDYIVEVDAYDVPSEGADSFSQVAHPTGFTEDKWVTAIEVIPGDASVLHHVLVWQGDDAGGGNPSSLVGGWAAGALPTVFPANTGRLLKAGAPVVSDMHYHPSGTAATDKTLIGLYFADEIEKELVNHWIIDVDFEIPAGDPYHQVAASHVFTQDSHILTLTPHAHYRGKDFVITASYPDGKQEQLLKVSDYDFNWQTGYEFQEPVAIPAGTRVDVVAHFDNSKKNASNPDYTKDVRFGNESFDEMMIGFVDYIVDEGVSPKAPPSPMDAKLVDLVKKYPGEIWTVDTPMQDGTVQTAAVHLPPSGDGGWYVEFASIVGRASLTEIVWDGGSFTATLTVPGQQPQDMSGTVDEASKTLAIGTGGGALEGNLAE